MLIEKKSSCKDSLKGKKILLTGAGGGIGYEAAKAFAYMGATIIIAEINEEKGINAAQSLNDNFPNAKIVFYKVDLSDEQQVRELYAYIVQNYGFVDILFHNATMTALGNVEEVPIEVWDKSYRVNFKAPLLITQSFLPEMKRRDEGIIVFVSSSGAAPYMGAYEVFKTAQVELCNTLCGELENTNVYAYSIGPGLVKTATAMSGIEIVASKMGMSTDEFYSMNGSHILGVEEAGCGFAISVLSAKKYSGQEIGSIQALLDSGLLDNFAAGTDNIISENQLQLINKIITVYGEQYTGWMTRNVFERQWILRDFKKKVGMSAEQYNTDIIHLKKQLDGKNHIDISMYKSHFEKLKQYFEHQYKLMQGFEKNPEKLKENSAIIVEWVDTLSAIIEHT